MIAAADRDFGRFSSAVMSLLSSDRTGVRSRSASSYFPSDSKRGPGIEGRLAARIDGKRLVKGRPARHRCHADSIRMLAR